MCLVQRILVHGGGGGGGGAGCSSGCFAHLIHDMSR